MPDPTPVGPTYTPYSAGFGLRGFITEEGSDRGILWTFLLEPPNEDNTHIRLNFFMDMEAWYQIALESLAAIAERYPELRPKWWVQVEKGDIAGWSP